MCLRDIQLKLYPGTSVFKSLISHHTVDQLVSLLTKTHSSLIKTSLRFSPLCAHTALCPKLLHYKLRPVSRPDLNSSHPGLRAQLPPLETGLRLLQSGSLPYYREYKLSPA